MQKGKNLLQNALDCCRIHAVPARKAGEGAPMNSRGHISGLHGHGQETRQGVGGIKEDITQFVLVDYKMYFEEIH